MSSTEVSDGALRAQGTRKKHLTVNCEEEEGGGGEGGREFLHFAALG